jgi:hypothetical protein
MLPRRESEEARVAAGRIEERAGREAGEQHQPGPRRHRAQHRVGRGVDVEQRQRRHEPVLGREFHPPREALAGHHVGPVGLRDELRAAGGARRRDQDRGVVRCRALQVRRRGVGGRQEALDLGVVQHEPGCCLADQAGQLGLAGGRVRRHQDRPQPHQTEPGEEMGGGIAHRNEDQISRRDPEFDQCGGGSADPTPGFLVGEDGVFMEEPGRIGGRFHGTEEQVRDRAFHSGRRVAVPGSGHRRFGARLLPAA